VGALSFSFRHVREFSPEDRDLVMSLAGQTAQVVERVRLYDQAQATSEANQFLRRASSELYSTLDPSQVLERLVKLSVTQMCDWCVVHLVREDGTVPMVIMTHSDVSKMPLLEDFRTKSQAETLSTVAEVLRSGKTLLFPLVSDSLLAGAHRGKEYLEALKAVGFRSAIVVPLACRGRVLGTLSLVCGPSGRRFNEEMAWVAEELGKTAGVAYDNAVRLVRARGVDEGLGKEQST
jgi:GAF domain-containing protein